MTEEAETLIINSLTRLRARRTILFRAGHSYSTLDAHVLIARQIRTIDRRIVIYEGMLKSLNRLGNLAEHVRQRQATLSPVTIQSRHHFPTSWCDDLCLRPKNMEMARVAHVIDGDGVRLDDGREVRYIGIDAPEMISVLGDPEPWAQEARDTNARLVGGRRVWLEREISETDHYGRLLRHLYTDDKWVSGELIRLGVAIALAIPPDVKYQAELERLQGEARSARRGIWVKKRPSVQVV